MSSMTLQEASASSEPKHAVDFDDSTLSGGDVPGSSNTRGQETDAEKTSHGAGNDNNSSNSNSNLDNNGENGDAPEHPPAFSFADVPDGGLKAWLVLLGAWCTSFCSFGWINSVGTFQEYYEAGPLKEYSTSTVAWIPSLQIFFMMAMGPVIGKLFDKFGPRHIIIVGSLFHVFGIMMASLSTTYYQILLSQGICSAIGVAAIFGPALSCIPGWFNRKRGMAYGIVSTGSSIGGIVFPIMVSRLIKSIGYAWAMRSCAFMILGLLVISWVTVQSRIHSHPNFKPGPGMSGAQMAAPFKERDFQYLLIGFFFLTFGIYVPITYLVVDAVDTGNVSQDLAQYLVAIFNAGSLFGRLLAGWAADTIGKYNAFSISCYLSGIIILALWIPGTSRSAVLAFAVLFGFFSGAYVSLIGSLVAQISPHKEIGYRTGLIFLTCSVPGLVTGPIAGAILALHGSWPAVKVFGGVTILVGTTFCFMARFVHTGNHIFKAF